MSVASAAAAQEINFLTHNSEAQSYLAESGDLRGKARSGGRAFYIELVREMIKDEGQQKANIVNVAFKRGYINTMSKPDHALFNVARNEERDLIFKWVGPIWTYKDYFVKHASMSEEPANLLDAQDFSICVVRGNVHDQELTRAGFKNLVRRNTYAECMYLVANKRVDLTPSAQTSLARKIEEAGVSPAQVAMTKILVSQHNGYIAFNKQTPEPTISKWQDILDRIKGDGRYDAIKEKYHKATDQMAAR